MKLISNRLVDQVHVKTMDVVGLVTPDVDKTLTPELAARLKHIRETE
jgi:arginase family enzyme